MEEDQTWYRQLLALVLLSASQAAVDFITKPGSRVDTRDQIREALGQVDFDAAAETVTKVIDNLAVSSKGKLSTTIDTLRDKSFDVVDEAKTRATDKLAPAPEKKGSKKMRFLFGLIFGALIAYFILDEQRRDDLLDRLTGASGPIQQPAPSTYTASTNTDLGSSSPASDPVVDKPNSTPQA